MSESNLWSTFVNFFLGRSLIRQGISFQSFTPKQEGKSWMPDPRQQDQSLGDGGLMFGKYIIVYDEVWSAEVLKLVQ